jgi:hypothetical protein
MCFCLAYSVDNLMCLEAGRAVASVRKLYEWKFVYTMYIVLCIDLGCNSDEKLSYHLSIFSFLIPWNPNIPSSFKTVCDIYHYLNYFII